MRSLRVLAVCAMTAGAVLVAPLSASAAAAGPPPRPAAPSSPSVTDHPLTAAPSPLNNPLEGFARVYSPGENQNTGYPRSLAWSYFGLSGVMTNTGNCAGYNWSIVDTR
jgi:hypothetical protein